MSPLEIQILLHYYCCLDEFPRLRGPIPPPAVKDAIAQFEAAGLLEPVPAGSDPDAASFRTTPAGSAYVHALCNLPQPTICWKVGDRYFDEHGPL